MTKKEIKEQLIQKLVRSILGKTKAKRTVIKKRKKVARKIDSKPKAKTPYTLKLSMKRLNQLLGVSVALANKSGDMFRVSESSKNLFTLTNIRTGTNTIYFKKNSFFREGMIQIDAAFDGSKDAYKVLAPIGLK